MKYERFDQLPAWNTAIELAVMVYSFTAKECFRGHSSLRDQIERAAVSVSNNIAEGFERGSNRDLINFLYIARGSAGEVRSMTALLARLPAFTGSVAERNALAVKSENVSRQLGAWIRNLRDSDRKGEQFVDRRSREKDRAAKERREFMDELERARRGDLK